MGALAGYAGCDLPSNLLDNLADESSALAQVALGAANAGLDDAGSGFLVEVSRSARRPSPAVCLVPSWEANAEILHEVRRRGRSYMALVDTL